MSDSEDEGKQDAPSALSETPFRTSNDLNRTWDLDEGTVLDFSVDRSPVAAETSNDDGSHATEASASTMEVLTLSREVASDVAKPEAVLHDQKLTTDEPDQQPSFRDVVAQSVNHDEDTGGPRDPAWRSRRKHFFVLSSAGKPIFTRHGDDVKLTSLFGVIQALISFVNVRKDHLSSIYAGDHTIVFLTRGPIYLCCASRTGESSTTLRMQLDLLYRQFVFILTSKLSSILSKQAGYDLRALLGGTDNAVRQLTSVMGTNMAFGLSAIKCVELPKQLRSRVGEVLEREAYTPNVLFAMLIHRNELVQIVRRRSVALDPQDLLLLMNFVAASPSMKLDQTWAPVCLPQFNDKGFVYAYIAYLASDMYLAIVSSKGDDFYALFTGKERIVERLFHENLMEQLMARCQLASFSLSSVPSLPPFTLLHFVYKSLLTSQYTYPRFEAPFDTPEEQKRIQTMYFHAVEALRGSQANKPCYFARTEGGTEAVYVIVTKQFMLALLLDGLVHKPLLAGIVKTVLKFIKNRESSLFVSSALMWTQ
jgi:hypothetical protein